MEKKTCFDCAQFKQYYRKDLRGFHQTYSGSCNHRRKTIKSTESEKICKHFIARDPEKEKDARDTSLKMHLNGISERLQTVIDLLRGETDEKSG